MFVAGDHLGVASHLNAANLAASRSQPQAFAKHGGRAKFGKWRASQDQKEKFADNVTMPDGFPEDICYSYNYRTCTENVQRSTFVVCANGIIKPHLAQIKRIDLTTLV